MTLTIEHSAPFADRVAALQLVDTDIHNDLPSLEALRPFLTKQWHPWLDSGGPGNAARYYANMGSGRMDDAVNEDDGLAAGDPGWVVQQLITKYRIDIGILHSPPLDAARWLRVEPIYAEPVILALPRTHPLAKRSRLALASLADESFVGFPRVVAPEIFDDIIASCRRAGFSPRIVQEAAGWHTLASLVSAGVGVGVVPRSIAEFQQAGVVYRSVRTLDVEMSLSAVWKRSERSPPRGLMSGSRPSASPTWSWRSPCSASAGG